MGNEKPPQGTFCWNELMTRDVPAAQKFYKELIGWNPTNSPMPGIDYTLLKSGENKDEGGMMAMPEGVPQQVPSHWMSYITVDDVDGATKRVTDLGGQVLKQPEDIPTVGRFSVIQDPTGATVGLITLAQK